jgi:hypothetical protein
MVVLFNYFAFYLKFKVNFIHLNDTPGFASEGFIQDSTLESLGERHLSQMRGRDDRTGKMPAGMTVLELPAFRFPRIPPGPHRPIRHRCPATGTGP